MKSLLIFLMSMLFSGAMCSKVVVYFNYGLFSTSSSRPYMETYLTITGNTVRYVPVKDGYQASVNISYVIKKGDAIVKVSKYVLHSPMAADSVKVPGFIDDQRFQLDNGTYTLELEISDVNAPGSKPTTYKGDVTINFTRAKKVSSSSIQVLESFAKTTTPTAFSKNGFDMIPYNVNYFAESQNSLKFYMETYNLDTVLGKGAKFVYSYYIEESSTLQKQQGLAGFQKQPAARVNPLLSQFDISKLPSGNYNLVIEVKDSTGAEQQSNKWFFQRKNAVADAVVALSAPKAKTIEDFFNQYQSLDTLKMFVECVWPISSTKEREWEQVQIEKRDPGLMRNFMVDYWKKESGDTVDPLKLWNEYYKEVLETINVMKCGKQKGYYTDRGRVYLQYGKPDQRSQINSSPNSYPYEVWQYYRMRDKTTGQFHSNKKFVFINFGIADDCYQLVHSDAKGERYDDHWQFRLVSRSQQTINVDDQKPVNTYGNNADDQFLNPR